MLLPTPFAVTALEKAIKARPDRVESFPSENSFVSIYFNWPPFSSTRTSSYFRRKDSLVEGQSLFLLLRTMRSRADCIEINS